MSRARSSRTATFLRDAVDRPFVLLERPRSGAAMSARRLKVTFHAGYGGADALQLALRFGLLRRRRRLYDEGQEET